MTEPIFGHEKLDVYRLSIEYVAASYGNSRHLPEWIGMRGTNGFGRRNRFHGTSPKGTASRVSQSRTGLFEIVRGSALECAAIHDILLAFAVVDEESNRQGKSDLRRIVSMQKRL
jgi:hypothetical protein